ncbi:hypothetical protein L9F63_012244 [Diploptera punctata]|uniref:F-BAR domain-containing protein n=1 Tax=Diploptera punctata TaxID=6984 RepID=A0AAD8AF61_DIPPU|nr:hypothetical protein L9F63_012244 [Diploptera punctata]
MASSTSTLVADSRPVSPRGLTISLPLELSSCADWETITELSDYKHDSDYEDVVTRDEYCEHRAQEPRRRRVRGAVRTRIRRAWRAVRGWWSEERLRITDVIQRHSNAQSVKDEPDNNVVRRKLRIAEIIQKHSREEPDNNGVRRRLRIMDVIQKHARAQAVKGEPDNNVVRRESAQRPGVRRSRYIPEGQNGFEELRRYIKQGGDFCKDLSAILQERSEAETQYAKSLSKLSGKLLKASRDSVGSVTQAWQRAGAQMEAQSEVHRAFAAALSEEVVKPLRQLMESQHRIRKSVESAVDKTGKSLSEWRSAEGKSKKQSFMCAPREREDAGRHVGCEVGTSLLHHTSAPHSTALRQGQGLFQAGVEAKEGRGICEEGRCRVLHVQLASREIKTGVGDSGDPRQSLFPSSGGGETAAPQGPGHLLPASPAGHWSQDGAERGQAARTCGELRCGTRHTDCGVHQGNWTTDTGTAPP